MPGMPRRCRSEFNGGVLLFVEECDASASGGRRRPTFQQVTGWRGSSIWRSARSRADRRCSGVIHLSAVARLGSMTRPSVRAASCWRGPASLPRRFMRHPLKHALIQTRPPALARSAAFAELKSPSSISTGIGFDLRSWGAWQSGFAALCFFVSDAHPARDRIQRLSVPRITDDQD